MACKPSEITNPHYKQIWDQLQRVNYPAHIIVYGREKNYITTHNRNEYGSAFSFDLCKNAEEAWHIVDNGWQGYPPDLDVYVIELVQPAKRLCDI